jgi:hypothetical protein
VKQIVIVVGQEVAPTRVVITVAIPMVDGAHQQVDREVVAILHLLGVA